MNLNKERVWIFNVALLIRRMFKQYKKKKNFMPHKEQCLAILVCYKDSPSEVCRVHAVVENVDPCDLAEGEVTQSNHKAVSVK